MGCNSSKFLLVIILTFLVGIVSVQVWQSFTQPKELSFRQDLVEVFPTTSNIRKVSLLSCEDIKKRKGEKAPLKRTVDGGVLNGKSCMAEPIYPQNAIAKRIDGRVNIEVFVDGFGNVRSAKAVSGHTLLKESAVKAAYRTKVMPHWLRGEPINIRGTLVFNFFLPD